jgi:hypothetical protein
MFTKTIEIDGIKATVHQETGRDVFAKRTMLRQISVDHDDEWEIWYEFTRVVTQSTDVETPFVWPDVTDSLPELTAARDAWLELPANVVRAWLEALNAVDAPPEKIELTPGASEKNVASQ